MVHFTSMTTLSPAFGDQSHWSWLRVPLGEPVAVRDLSTGTSCAAVELSEYAPSRGPRSTSSRQLAIAPGAAYAFQPMSHWTLPAQPLAAEVVSAKGQHLQTS